MSEFTGTNSELNALFRVSADGVLWWNRRPRSVFKNSQAHSAWNSRYADTEAGSATDRGYIVVRIFGRRFLAHRIAYAIHHGLDMESIPDEIDHKNQDGTNNSATNLRPATHSQNLCNVGKWSSNTSGLKGAFWSKRRRRWESKIRHAGKRYYLGTFNSAMEAHEAYKAKAEMLHQEFARMNNERA